MYNNKEIFLTINNDIINNIYNGYSISNNGKLIGIKGRVIGNYRERYKRIKAHLKLNNGDCLYNIDIATLEYCTFNNIRYNPSLRINFKDNNPYNLQLENLYLISEINITNIDNINTPIINQKMSLSDYNNDKQLLVIPSNELWVSISTKEVPYIRNNFYISNYGRLFNGNINKLSSLSISDNGYISCIISGNDNKIHNMLIHRTVMKCFRPIINSEMYEVDHIDSNTFNNTLNNLRWVDHNYNEYLRIMKNPERITFSESQVIEICKAFQNKMSPMQISYYVLHQPYTGNLHSKIMNIYKRKTYQNISSNFIF